MFPSQGKWDTDYDFPWVSCATWQNCIHSVVIFMVKVCANIHINSHVPVTRHIYFTFLWSYAQLCPMSFSKPSTEKEILDITMNSGFLPLHELCHSSCSYWAEWKTVHQLLLQRQLQICNSWTALWPFVPVWSSSKWVDYLSGSGLGCYWSNNKAVMEEPMCRRKIPDQGRVEKKRLGCLEK